MKFLIPFTIQIEVQNQNICQYTYLWTDCRFFLRIPISAHKVVTNLPGVHTKTTTMQAIKQNFVKFVKNFSDPLRLSGGNGA